MNLKYFNRLIILSASLLMLGLGGCKKYLDQQPITAVGPEFVFNDIESTRGALLGVYKQLAGDDGYGLKISLYFGVGEDLTQGPTGAADAGRRDFPLYATTASNGQMTGPYNQLFRGIQYANECITNIPKMEMYNNGTDQQKAQLRRMHGEALTLRAQFYFEAIRNWGDLPAHFEPAEEQATQDPFPKRTDRDVLYDRLLTDLKTAAEVVPWRTEVGSIGDPVDERITKGTVKGLRARIALFRAGYSLRGSRPSATGQMERGANYQTYYQIARDETNDILTSNQHSLNPNFKDLWKNQVGSRVIADPNGELMFQVTAFGRSAAADAKVGFNSGPTVYDPATQTSGPTGTASVFILPTYFYYFDSTDLRRDVSIAPYQDTVAADGVTFYKRGQQITTLFDGKYRRDWLNPVLPAGTYANNYTGYKWQILRYSDVLLMFAEAENELSGPTGAAYNAINMVRRRGFGKPINTADVTVDIPGGLSKADFFKHLVRERALELGGEGIRKFDLIRWNLLATAITETRANLNKMGDRQTLTVPSYMAPPPSYTLNTANLPTAMYFRLRTTSEDLTIGGLAVHSFYRAQPSSTPSGTRSTTWITRGNLDNVLAHYTNSFTANKSELMPIPQNAINAYGGFSSNMPQNPGY
jgi:starch-binding outer membrane protein, SusD/RagB family